MNIWKQLVLIFFTIGAFICMVWGSFLISKALGLFVLGCVFFLIAWGFNKVLEEEKEKKKNG